MIKAKRMSGAVADRLYRQLIDVLRSGEQDPIRRKSWRWLRRSAFLDMMRNSSHSHRNSTHRFDARQGEVLNYANMSASSLIARIFIRRVWDWFFG